MKLSSSIALLTIFLSVEGRVLQKRDSTVSFDGRSFVNHGLIGFGRFSASAVDSYGETIGGIGSSIGLESFQKNKDGTYSGNIRLNPDRGHNTQGTTDYRARSHKFTFSFNPNLGGPTTENVVLKYQSSVLYTDGIPLNYTTGLDPTVVRPANLFSPALPIAPSDNHLSIDQEGFALSKDGLIAYISDEYGPYIYVTQRQSGIILATIAPPTAITPMIGGKLNFTSETTADTGRAANQGFEGLTLDRNTDILWALLQSSTIQDSIKGSKTTNRYSRLLAYDVKISLKPKLLSEYIVPLPQSNKKNTRASSELHIVDATTFLVLARDGNGFGDTSSDSSYKNVDLISIKGATNIANTPFDTPTVPVAPGGVLNSAIVPVQYTPFLSLIDKTQLAKFGLQVGGAFDHTLIASKLESLALTPLDSTNSNQLLFVVSDNDFITTKGHQAVQDNETGKYILQNYSDPYAEANGDGDSQFFIYNVTLPGYSQGGVPN